MYSVHLRAMEADGWDAVRGWQGGCAEQCVRVAAGWTHGPTREGVLRLGPPQPNVVVAPFLSHLCVPQRYSGVHASCLCVRRRVGRWTRLRLVTCGPLLLERHDESRRDVQAASEAAGINLAYGKRTTLRVTFDLGKKPSPSLHLSACAAK